MTRRPPGRPPELAGYAHQRLLGSGGFADVFLYQQALPSRLVAVKVLVAAGRDSDDDPVARFAAEANVMAALSTHPAIVTIHQAGRAPDGRPYIVMEYCSRPNLAARYRAERLGVPEVLRIGVRLAGAVQTAHQAGILHRDIKPANVLTTDFGHPALTDFGIASSQLHPEPTGEMVGMSIPWTAPEVLAHGTGTERSDVYSLAATLYTVLARRSPFDRPGGPNTSADLMARIRTSAVPGLARPDAPPSLERVLIRAMDKNPAVRHRTALDFGRALQQIETEMRLAPTPMDVLDERPVADEVPGEAGATRIRAITVIDPKPEPGPPAPGGFAPAPQGPAPQGPAPQGPATSVSTPVPPVGMSQHGRPGSTRVPQPGRPGTASGAPVRVPDAAQRFEDTAPRPGAAGPATPRRRGPLLAGAGVLVAAAIGVTVLILTRGGGQPAPPPDAGDQLTTTAPTNAAVAGAVPVPVRLSGTVEPGGVVFTWQNPAPEPGDSYQWNRTVNGAVQGDAHRTDTPRAVIGGTGRVCISVIIVRQDGTSSPQPATGCAGSG